MKPVPAVGEQQKTHQRMAFALQKLKFVPGSIRKFRMLPQFIEFIPRVLHFFTSFFLPVHHPRPGRSVT